MVDLFPAAAAFLAGLALGSFLNVCIYRLPQHRSVVFPGSACPACQHPIRFYDNIPLLSWALLRGRCRDCQARISVRYPAVELLVALLFLACYRHFGITPAGLKFAVFGWLLIGLLFSDAETRLLPNSMTLPGLAAGLLFSWFVPVRDLVTQITGIAAATRGSSLPWQWISLADSLLGAVVGASFLYGIGALYLRARGVEGMGLGDVKLMAMVGSFLGLKLTLFTLFTASIAGSLYGIGTMLAVWLRRTRRFLSRRQGLTAARSRAWKSARIVYRHYQMPFGVFLSGMAMVAATLGDRFLSWYWGLV
jgi:leader peptidase (prepilin peptidase)/N-methyltransferase